MLVNGGIGRAAGFVRPLRIPGVLLGWAPDFLAGIPLCPTALSTASASFPRPSRPRRRGRPLRGCWSATPTGRSPPCWRRARRARAARGRARGLALSHRTGGGKDPAGLAHILDSDPAARIEAMWRSRPGAGDADEAAACAPCGL